MTAQLLGTIDFADQAFEIVAAPHIRGRLRRIFPRVRQRGDTISMKATAETCRDLQWVIGRYPLQLSDDAARRIADGSIRWEAGRQHARRVMAPDYKPAPVAMALPPRDYQARAAELAAVTGGLLVVDDMGLGKTVTGIALLVRTECRPALVVCPTHLQRQWQREINKFAPGLRVEIAATTAPHDVSILGMPPDVLIITYAKLHGWSAVLGGEVRCVVFDEVQDLRRTTSQKYEAAMTIAAGADFRLGLSGTPIYNYGDEFHAVLSVLRPDLLGERDEFLREWTGGGRSISDPAAFGAYIRDESVMLRRSRADVGRELPPLTRVFHTVDSDRGALAEVQSDAVRLARMILDRGASVRDRWHASGELDARLRRATGMAKAPFVADFVRMLVADGPVVLFGWHRSVYDVWRERLADLNPAWYTGSESPAQKDASAARFMAGDTDLMIVSLRSGAGLDGLQERCSTVVVGELDWAFGPLEQGECRIFRDGQRKPVFAYYAVADDGADPAMRDALAAKEGQIEPVRNPDAHTVFETSHDPDRIKDMAAEYLRRHG